MARLRSKKGHIATAVFSFFLPFFICFFFFLTNARFFIHVSETAHRTHTKVNRISRCPMMQNMGKKIVTKGSAPEVGGLISPPPPPDDLKIGRSDFSQI